MKRDKTNAAIFVVIVLALTGAITVGFYILGITDGSTANLLMFLPGVVALGLLALRRESLGSMGWKPGRLAYWGWALILPLVALGVWALSLFR